MNLFIVAAVLAVAAAAPSSYSKDAEIAIVAQSDVRNVDGSGAWSYAGSDGTTRDESYAQKQLAAQSSYGKDAYGKEYESGAGHTNKGATYYISPEGQKITLTWVADENGFQPKGDHLPVAPVHVYELPVAPALPYVRSGPGF
ncbi:cuticle protein CP14.6-like isoform X2 [Daphnia carinata]|uniref:cuticle protein CP14.6-like isoform X2 n=1 Tax=Daphnia carinata TaxID=120202 RepID=UPI002580C348|nr:cuticle protein CP14.6-like isoform X2 [Daphnia carinata]